MSPPDGPRVSVSIVTYNGLRWLPGCLAALVEQTLEDFELLVLDNASTDGTPEWLRAQLALEPRMRLEISPTNLGFAAGQNRNIERATGDFICLLNQDVELDPLFLREALAPMLGRPSMGAVQGRILRLDAPGERGNTIDTTGLVMQRSRRAVSRGQGLRDGRDFSRPGPIWGADGPAPVYRRAALVEAREPRTGGGWEVLDEDFFMYKEDVDLAWRLHRLGWQSWYQPTAVGWHGRTASAGPDWSLLSIARSNRSIPRWIKQMSWRNQRLMQIKNESSRGLLRDWPWVAGREILSLGYTAIAEPRRLAGAAQFVQLLPRAVRKRTHLERVRRHASELTRPDPHA